MQETDQFHPAPKTPGLSMVIALTTLLLVAASDFLLFYAEWGIGLFLASLIIALAISAFAWRCLVLILLRIWWKRSNAWLIACNLVSLLIVLYGSALVDFSAIISRFNVAHSLEVSGEGLPLDLVYISQQGPSAIPALDSFLLSLKPDRAAWHAASDLRENLGYKIARWDKDWRGWSWRQQRLADYLAPQPVAYGPQTLQNTPSGPR
jgi:hypothetical protein